MEDGSRAKIDEFDDVAGRHDTVIKFEVTMGKTDGVEVVNAFADLAEDTVDLRTAHLLRHDNTKEVVGSILHHLVIVATIANDVDGFDYIRMLERGTNTKFSGDLLLVLLFALAGSLRPELLDSEYVTPVLSLDQSDGTAGARTEDSAPFAVLFGKMSLSGLGEGYDRVGDLGGSFAACGDGRIMGDT